MKKKFTYLIFLIIVEQLLVYFLTEVWIWTGNCVIVTFFLLFTFEVSNFSI